MTSVSSRSCVKLVLRASATFEGSVPISEDDENTGGTGASALKENVCGCAMAVVVFADASGATAEVKDDADAVRRSLERSRVTSCSSFASFSNDASFAKFFPANGRAPATIGSLRGLSPR